MDWLDKSGLVSVWNKNSFDVWLIGSAINSVHMHNDEMMLCGKVSSEKSFDPFCNRFESFWWICVGVQRFRANTRKCLRHRFFINGTKVVRLNLLSMLHRDMRLLGSTCVTHSLDGCTLHMHTIHNAMLHIYATWYY